MEGENLFLFLFFYIYKCMQTATQSSPLYKYIMKQYILAPILHFINVDILNSPKLLSLRVLFY